MSWRSVAILVVVLLQINLSWGYFSAPFRRNIAVKASAKGTTVKTGEQLWSDLLATDKQVPGTRWRAALFKTGFSSSRKGIKSFKSLMEVKTAFFSAFRQPISPPFKDFISDMLVSASIQTIDASFKYDSLFAFGLCTRYYTIMRYYDKQQDIEPMFDSLVRAIGFEPETIRSDAKKMLCLARSSPDMSESDFLAQHEGELATIFDQVRANSLFKFCDSWGIGLGRLMELRGVAPDIDAFNRWTKSLHWIPAIRVSQSWTQFLSEQLRMQMYRSHQQITSNEQSSRNILYAITQGLIAKH